MSGAIAAAVVAGIGIGALWMQQRSNMEPIRTEVATGVGDRATVALADGSVIRLAPSTRVRVREWSARAEVDLEGRAFFSIIPDSSRLFRVRTKSNDVEVLGTRFDVDAYAAEVRVVVIEGRVAIAAAGDRVEAVTGQMVSTTLSRSPSIPVAVDTRQAIEWLGWFMAFSRTPLHQVANELEQSYGVQVEIEGPALGARTVTAAFGEQPLDEVVPLICRVVEAHCEISDSIIFFRNE